MHTYVCEIIIVILTVYLLFSIFSQHGEKDASHSGLLHQFTQDYGHGRCAPSQDVVIDHVSSRSPLEGLLKGLGKVMLGTSFSCKALRKIGQK